MPTTHIAAGEDMDQGTTHPGDGTLNSIYDRLDALEALFPHGFGFSTWTPRLVVNDANASNGYVPTANPSPPPTYANPALGSGTAAGSPYAAGANGRVFQVGKLVIATFNITFGATGVSAGNGAYRVTLPYPCAASPSVNGSPIGFGHLFNPSVPNTFFGLGPGNFRHFMLHSPAAAVATDVAGLVIGVNNPRPAALAAVAGNVNAFILSHHVDDFTLDETSTSTTELAHIIGSLINADVAAYQTTIFDNTSDANPWVWSAGCRVVGVQVYEAA